MAAMDERPHLSLLYQGRPFEPVFHALLSLYLRFLRSTCTAAQPIAYQSQKHDDGPTNYAIHDPSLAFPGFDLLALHRRAPSTTPAKANTL